MANRDVVWMTHPETGGRVQVTEKAFVEAWEPRGWQRAPADEGGNSGAPEKPDDEVSSEASTGDAEPEDE